MSDNARLGLGNQHSIIVKRDGSVWSAGANDYGQLGFGPPDGSLKFVRTFVIGAKGVAVGDDHSMILKEDGSVWGTGQNVYGQLGDGSRIGKRAFVQVLSSDAVAVCAGVQIKA